MMVVPPSDHLFVIFIFDAVFSHGRSGSVSGNVVDAIINVIVIIVFFFLFGVDIKAAYKFIIEFLFKITKIFELLFRKKIKDLIHSSLSEFFTGNKRKVLHFIFLYPKLLHKQGSGYGDSISNLCQKYVKSKQNRKRFCFCYFYKSRGICFFNKELFLFDFSVLCLIKNTGKSVSVTNKKKIQKGSVFNKITS